MLVSTERRMVYLAHPKTASKATRQLLEELGFIRYPEGDDYPMDAAETPTGHHRGLWSHPGPGWFVFTTIRDPWDTWVSWYCFHNPSHLPFGVEYIELLVDRYPHFYPEPDQLWALHTVFADRVMRFETLEQDLADVLGQPVVLPRVNVGAARRATKKLHYSEFYDDETREYVGSRFKHEIEEYGYTYSNGGDNE